MFKNKITTKENKVVINQITITTKKAKTFERKLHQLMKKYNINSKISFDVK